MNTNKQVVCIDKYYQPVQLLAHDDRISRARNYIESNFAEPITLAKLSQHAGAEIRTLQRLFRRETGRSPTRYLLDCRLNNVHCKLVESEPGSGIVTQVALSSGFNHLGHFTAQYRKYFGETPRQTLYSRNLTGRALNFYAASLGLPFLCNIQQRCDREDVERNN